MRTSTGNPNHSRAADDCGRRPGRFFAGAGNFCMLYNLTSASIALSVMRSAPHVPLPPPWAHYFLLSIVFVGCAVGMSWLGYLGDKYGRAYAIRMTLALTAIGAILPACATGPADVWYTMIVVGRFILGIGVGGIYPLNAVHTAELGGSVNERALRVGWGFIWQIPGMMVPYVCAAVLDQYPPSQVKFRLLFALGVIPVLCMAVSSYAMGDSEEFTVARTQRQDSFRELFLAQPARTKWALAGLCITWFIYDVAAYGVLIFLPHIVSELVPSEDSAWKRDLLVVVLLFTGLSGILAALHMVEKRGLKFICTSGFFLMSFSFCVLDWAFAINGGPLLKLVAFSGVMCALNFGPNLSTYIIPALCFPAHVRSTFHGLSATAGKWGAFVGTFAFVPLVQAGGVHLVVFTLSIISVLGAWASHSLLPELNDPAEVQGLQSKNVV